MAVMTMERPTSEDDEGYEPSDDGGQDRAAVMRALHDQLDPPPGWRVEIIEGEFAVSATPFGKHALIVLALREAIAPTLHRDIGLFENTTLEEPGADRIQPDLAAWPLALLNTESEWAFPGAECSFAAEVTSPDQENRDYAKARSYARAGTPVYLLVDRKRRACMVFTEPEVDHYLTRHEIPFGKPVTLPLDPPVTFDTADF